MGSADSVSAIPMSHPHVNAAGPSATAPDPRASEIKAGVQRVPPPTAEPLLSCLVEPCAVAPDEVPSASKSPMTKALFMKFSLFT